MQAQLTLPAVIYLCFPRIFWRSSPVVQRRRQVDRQRLWLFVIWRGILILAHVRGMPLRGFVHVHGLLFQSCSPTRRQTRLPVRSQNRQLGSSWLHLDHTDSRHLRPLWGRGGYRESRWFSLACRDWGQAEGKVARCSKRWVCLKDDRPPRDPSKRPTRVPVGNDAVVCAYTARWGAKTWLCMEMIIVFRSDILMYAAGKRLR